MIRQHRGWKYKVIIYCLFVRLVILYNWTLAWTFIWISCHNHTHTDIDMSAPPQPQQPLPILTTVEQPASGAAKRRKLTREEKTEARRVAKEEAAREKAAVNAALLANTSEFLDPPDMAAFSEFLAKNIAVRKFVTHLLMHRTNQLMADYNNLSDWHDEEPDGCAEFLNGTFEEQMAAYTEHIHNEIMSDSEHESPEF
jgi:hypothetical protein